MYDRSTGGMDTAASGYPAENYLGWRHTIKSSINQKCNWPEKRWGERALQAGYCCHLWCSEATSGSWEDVRMSSIFRGFQILPWSQAQVFSGLSERIIGKHNSNHFLKSKEVIIHTKKIHSGKGRSNTIKLHVCTSSKWHGVERWDFKTINEGFCEKKCAGATHKDTQVCFSDCQDNDTISWNPYLFACFHLAFSEIKSTNFSQEKNV